MNANDLRSQPHRGPEPPERPAPGPVPEPPPPPSPVPEPPPQPEPPPVPTAAVLERARELADVSRIGRTRAPSEG